MSSNVAEIKTVIINETQAIGAGINPALFIGPPGPTPELEIGTVEYGDDPSATITGTPENPVLNLVLPRGLQGIQGDTGGQGGTGPEGPQGVSIQSIERTEGTGMPGTVDTYTITLTNGATATLTVYNGKDGSGAGDMSMAQYDTDGNGKVDSADHADDADKLGGVAAEDYARKTDIPGIPYVPEWAMEPQKPTYTASEVGALASTATATDSAKLGGQVASYYAPATALDGKANTTTMNTELAKKQSIPPILTLTLLGGASNWPGNVQTVDAPGVVLGDGQVGRPIPADEGAYNDAGIKLLAATAANKAAFKCETVPGADMVVRLVLTEVKPYVAG